MGDLVNIATGDRAYGEPPVRSEPGEIGMEIIFLLFIVAVVFLSILSATFLLGDHASRSQVIGQMHDSLSSAYAR